MKMKSFIEMGSAKAGSNKALAKILGQSEVALCEAKVGKRGLNDAVCIKLADFINVNRIEVIAASNLVTEKDEERRKIYESCFTTAASVIFLMVTVYNFFPFPSETSTSVLAATVYFALC